MIDEIFNVDVMCDGVSIGYIQTLVKRGSAITFSGEYVQWT